MLLSLRKLTAGGAAVLLAILLHTYTVQGASIRHHRQRGGEQGGLFSPSSDMIKALEYIESLKRRTDGPESPTADYDEVDKFRFLVQLASLQDQDAPDHEDVSRWLESSAPQWVKSLLQTLEQAGENVEAAPALTTRPSKNRHKPADPVSNPVRDYSGLVKPHKKYPLMFEDEENTRDSTFKRTTEDMEEQYTPQSLANMRSIFEELGKLSSPKDQKRGSILDQKIYSSDNDDEEDEEPRMFRNLEYEDVTGGEDWVPLEEQMETEEVVKGSHEEFDRGLGNSEEEEEEMLERRSTQDPDDDTKLVDYYLLKVLEMTDQEQKRDLSGALGNRRKLLRHPLIDPQALNKLLAISLKLQVPPEELMEMLLTEEIRKQERPMLGGGERSALPRYRNRMMKYYNRRLPESRQNDFKTEDILNTLGLNSLAKPRPYKTTVSRFYTPSGRRGSLFMSEFSKAPSKRRDDYDDTVGEDELATFLAAKILTEYPDTEKTKRAAGLVAPEKFPYELYEEAMKDYFDQAETGKSAPVKRDTEAKEEMEVPKMSDGAPLEASDQQTPEPGKEEEQEHHGKKVAGM
ncbi:secretogranin-2b [Denticeps clupeoides]|uniref:Secretoneurin n=1 Tax=Denticeps clupeoides TaxID=299321 RepID=A0AAY4AUA4_9TELE|nr:secretogranin-2-like [Denticeps clupeoides]XP_028831038.1 secretogranin-2-like [Denticeps clupeoides]